MSAEKTKQKIKFTNRQKKWCFRIVLMLWLIFSILAVIAYRKPLEVEETIRKNLIKQTLQFDYSVEALPEGILSLSEAIFTKSQKQMKVKVESLVSSDEPVFIKGTSLITVKLVAEELWEKTLLVYPEKLFSFKGQSNKMIDAEVDIDLENLYNELERISNDILGVRAKNYYLKVIPEIKGEIVFGDLKLPIQNDGEFVLSLEGEQVKLAGEKAYSKDTPVEETKFVTQGFSMFGKEYSLLSCRYVFSSISLLFMVLAIAVFIAKKKNSRKDINSEVIEINKKYGIRLTPILSLLDIEGKTLISLQSFKALVKISDEKDRGILKYEDEQAHHIYYYLIDGEYIYRYGLTSKIEEKMEFAHEGGNISHGA